MLFRRHFNSEFWFAKYPYGRVGTGRSWTLLPILPGSDAGLTVQGFVFSCDPCYGAANSALVAGSTKVVAWSLVAHAAVDDRDVLVNGAKFLSCHSNAQAHYIVKQIEQLRSLSSAAREPAIEQLARDALALGVRKQLEEFQARTRTIRALATAMWIISILILPAALLIAKNDAVLIPAGVLIWLFAALIAVATIVAKRQLAPPGKRPFPWASFKYVLYPVAALRALDDLAENLFAGVHPAVLCLELCGGEEQGTSLRDLFLKTLYPVYVSRARDSDEDDLADAVSEYFNRLAVKELRIVLERNAPDVLKNLTPKRRDGNCLSWCPRCQSQYQLAEGDCVDCPKIKLQVFPVLNQSRKTGL